MSGVLPSTSLMRWALALVAIVIAALVGSQFGASRERTKSASVDGSLSNGKGAQDRVAELIVERDIADASNKSLLEKVELLEAELFSQESTTSLYEKIEGTDVSTGLGVDTISRVTDADGNLSELHITVVQARGRNRVKGRIGVSLVGTKDDSNWQEIIFEADASDAPRFDMRFFQTMVVPVKAQGILIDFVEINVQPEGKQHKPFQYEAEWASIFED